MLQRLAFHILVGVADTDFVQTAVAATPGTSESVTPHPPSDDVSSAPTDRDRALADYLIVRSRLSTYPDLT